MGLARTLPRLCSILLQGYPWTVSAHSHLLCSPKNILAVELPPLRLKCDTYSENSNK